MNKISKSDKIDKEQEASDRSWFANRPASQHFEPGTFVTYKNTRYLLLCYRESDGRMVLDNENETLVLDTYSMLWR